MYLENSVKAALGLIGHTNPPLELVQQRVQATGFKGYVAAGYVPPKPSRTKKPKAGVTNEQAGSVRQHPKAQSSRKETTQARTEGQTD